VASPVLTEDTLDTAGRPDAPASGRQQASRSTRYGLRLLAICYVGILVIAPVVTIAWRSFDEGGQVFWDAISNSEAIHAYQLTAVVAGWAVVINTVFGVGVALLLVRFRFPGKRLLSVVIDLGVSVSPVVVGLALILVYGYRTGWFGTALRDAGVQVIFATPGMVLATCFVCLPLVVREVVPVLEEAGIEQEQAAQSLGASALQRFLRITLPTIKWAIAYGVVLSLARSLGEFGALKVVSGHVVGKTDTVTLLIDQRAENLEPGAYQLSIVLMSVSVLAIIVISIIRPKENR
jgi:sulfate/thiosulfate transport system permease protein